MNLNQIIHNVFVITDNPARKILIKGCFAISQKRLMGFSWEEGRLGRNTEIVLCDMGSAESLMMGSQVIKERQQQGGVLVVIFIYDSVLGHEASKELVRRAGLENWWRPELVLDSKSHWARLLGVLELAAKKRESAGGASTPPPSLAPVSASVPSWGAGATVAPQSVPRVIPHVPPPPPPPPVQVPQVPVRPQSPFAWIPAPVQVPVLVPQQQTHVAAQAPSAPRVDTRKPISILLVDDSESARNFVVSKLQSTWDQHFIFDMAQTGQEAKAKCQEKKYDILFLDVMLPDLDGYAVCKNLKNTKNIHSLAVMLTSKGGAFDKLKGVMSGCDMYLVKPLDEAEIKLLVKKYTAEYM